MTDVAGGLLYGLGVALAPGNLLACFVGVFVGTLIGVLPGHRSGGDHVAAPARHLCHVAHRVDHHDGGHLLRGDVRRIHHVDPREPAGRSGLGGDVSRRLPDGAAGAGGPRAGHRRVRIVHRGHRERAGHHAARPAAHEGGAVLRAARDLRPACCSASPWSRISPRGRSSARWRWRSRACSWAPSDSIPSRRRRASRTAASP